MGILFSVLVIIIVVAGGLLLVLSDSGKGRPQAWLQFYAKGKESGFTLKEIDLLRRLSIKSSLEDPSSLFYSQDQLDLCIRSLVKNMQMGGRDSDQEGQDFLSKLYDFRKKIEMEKPSKKNGLSNSRQISDGQKLRILLKGAGVFRSEVIKNSNQYLTVSRPITYKQQPGAFSWTGQQVSIYFWRENDAGYVFDTDVVDEVFSKGIASLKIGHTDALFRTQKRKSIRVKLHKSAYLYLILNEEDVHKVEVNPGIKCFLEDLSDTGCAITVGGKGVSDLRIKVQFALKNNPIVMTGTVRSAEFKEDTNRSLLHIEADPMPIDIRNQILGEVFGMLPDEEEDLPFRVLDEEAEAMAAPQDPARENVESALLAEE